MINWPVTRDDISVRRTLDDVLHIQVGDKDNSFGVSVKPDASVTDAIKLLMENICHKTLGITEHDFMMKTFDFFEEEEGVRD